MANTYMISGDSYDFTIEPVAYNPNLLSLNFNNYYDGKPCNITFKGKDFAGCANLRKVIGGQILNTNIGYFFYENTSLDTFTTKMAPTTCWCTFRDCTSLSEIPESVDLSKLEYAADMFDNAGLTSVTQNLPVLKISQTMFACCNSLTSASINAPMMYECDAMFNQCSSLFSVDITMNAVADATGRYNNAHNMFDGCYKLKNLHISGFPADPLTEIDLRDCQDMYDSLVWWGANNSETANCTVYLPSDTFSHKDMSTELDKLVTLGVKFTGYPFKWINNETSLVIEDESVLAKLRAIPQYTGMSTSITISDGETYKVWHWIDENGTMQSATSIDDKYTGITYEDDYHASATVYGLWDDGSGKTYLTIDSIMNELTDNVYSSDTNAGGRKYGEWTGKDVIDKYVNFNTFSSADTVASCVVVERPDDWINAEGISWSDPNLDSNLPIEPAYPTTENYVITSWTRQYSYTAYSDWVSSTEGAGTPDLYKEVEYEPSDDVDTATGATVTMSNTISCTGTVTEQEIRDTATDLSGGMIDGSSMSEINILSATLNDAMSFAVSGTYTDTASSSQMYFKATVPITLWYSEAGGDIDDTTVNNYYQSHKDEFTVTYDSLNNVRATGYYEQSTIITWSRTATPSTRDVIFTRSYNTTTYNWTRSVESYDFVRTKTNITFNATDESSESVTISATAFLNDDYKEKNE